MGNRMIPAIIIGIVFPVLALIVAWVLGSAWEAIVNIAVRRTNKGE